MAFTDLWTLENSNSVSRELPSPLRMAFVRVSPGRGRGGRHSEVTVLRKCSHNPGWRGDMCPSQRCGGSGGQQELLPPSVLALTPLSELSPPVCLPCVLLCVLPCVLLCDLPCASRVHPLCAPVCLPYALQCVLSLPSCVPPVCTCVRSHVPPMCLPCVLPCVLPCALPCGSTPVCLPCASPMHSSVCSCVPSCVHLCVLP